MKVYLVTGAAGFIGAAVASRLINEGHKVVTIDNLSTGFINNIPSGVDFIEGNCQDKETLKKLSKYKFNAIFHIAGQSSGEISFDNPVYDLQTNTQSTLLLLKYALKNNCEDFIYASSMSVYGEQPDKPVKEDVYPNPKSFYGIGKLASEHYLRIYQEYGINSTALRLFNVYGPGQNMENLRQGMVSIFLAQAINNKHIIVKGSSKRFRDFIYIDDVVDAFIATANKKKNQFDIFNISTSVKTKVSELISQILNILPFEISVEYSGFTPGDQHGIYGNINKILNELSWKPKIGLKAGLEIMIKNELNKN